jgi:hypothetical protein
MRRSTLLLFCIALSSFCSAQKQKNKEAGAGEFALGIRSSSSTFGNSTNELTGIGTGGDFRIRLSDRVNTEWFADYILSTQDFLIRNDAHIGWSVLFYPFNFQNKGFKPYALAGHCFDYTELVDRSNYTHKADRWSSAVQGGIGTHYYFTKKFDFSIQVQYMLHLGTRLETEIVESQLNFIKSHHGALSEGHLLFTASFNYTFGKLWGKN